MLLPHHLIQGAGAHPDGERTARGGIASSPGSPADGGNGSVVVVIIAWPVPEEIIHIDRLLPVLRLSRRSRRPAKDALMPARTAAGGQRGHSVRTAFIAGSRLAGWAERFGAAHGGFQVKDDDDGLHLLASDGAEALLQAPWPADGRPGRGADELERLASLASQPRRLGLLLVRRGGYGVAVVSEGAPLASKVGSTYVQSRTAAGGQSQQRFARRRSNQADALVQTVAEQALRIFTSGQFEYVVPGGDRALAGLVLQHPALKDYAALPRLAYLDVPDPKAAVLRKAAADACSVRVQVSDAPVG